MRRGRTDRRGRIVVPLDLSAFAAPWGQWLVPAERRGPRVKTRPLTLTDLVVGIGVNVVLYGPSIAGGVAGWQRTHGWTGALIGAGIAIGVQLAALFMALPVVGFVKARKER